MKKTISILLVIIILFTMPVYANNTKPLTDKQLEKLYKALIIIKEEYPFTLKDSQLYDGALKGIFRSVDNYSDYFNPEETQAFYDEMEGKFAGIGVYISQVNGTGLLRIESVIPGTPAEKAKLQAGDIITAIDGANIEMMDYSASSRLMRGKPGSKVNIYFLRGDTIYTATLIRAEVKINPVSYKIINNNIGYIKLSEFTEGSAEKVKGAMDAFSSKGIGKLILDLRDNPGGLLTEAIDMGKFLIPKGKIVSIKTVDGIEGIYYSYMEEPKFKLCLLVNGNSASASEIIAGAVKDTKAGTIIGTKTFGKGIVQRFMPLQDGSALKFTYAEYLTPSGTSIHKKGVSPDIEIKNTVDKDGKVKDVQLEKAVALFTK